jgi:hypothetical protein
VKCKEKIKNNQNINAKIGRKRKQTPFWGASQATLLFIVVGSTQCFILQSV